jgi:hypothetical protein
VDGRYQGNPGNGRDERPLHICIKLVRVNQVDMLLIQQPSKSKGPAPVCHPARGNNMSTNSTTFASFLYPSLTKQTEDGPISRRIKGSSQVADDSLGATGPTTGRKKQNCLNHFYGIPCMLCSSKTHRGETEPLRIASSQPDDQCRNLTGLGRSQRDTFGVKVGAAPLPGWLTVYA